jgi:4-hydroxybenzoate polyprenyltransferase
MKNYLSLIKFSHTIFALPFALIGFFLAYPNGNFSINILIYVLLCMIFARSAAMAFNRYIDREIDTINPRTSKTREIPNKKIKASSALAFIILNSFLFVTTTYFINQLCFFLSPLALLIILGYSYTKRFTSLCHLILGVGLSLSPIGAYLAVTETFDRVPIIFSLIVLFWVAGFDIIYSLQDEEFDAKNNLKSIPVFCGKKNALIVAKLLHSATVILIVYVGWLFDNFNVLYWGGAFIFSALLVFQHSIISKDDLSRINIAFFTTNGIASVVFGVFVILDILI